MPIAINLLKSMGKNRENGVIRLKTGEFRDFRVILDI
jgi:hypothetical protein